MKTRFLKVTLSVLTLGLVASCDVEETDKPVVMERLMTEDFQSATDATDLDITGWVNFNEVGNKKWKEEVFSGNGYAEFSSYNTGDAVNVGWLISPQIDLDAAAKKGIAFKVAQHHLDVDAEGNSLQVLISTNFDGTNVTAATWEPLSANIPKKAESWYTFLPSNIDLSGRTGKAYIAFKFKGSGTDTTLDGAFQLDDFIYYKID